MSLAGRRFVDKSALRFAVGFACSLSREPRALPCLRVLKISPRPQSLDNTLEIGAVPSLHPAAVVCRRLSALLGTGFNVPDPKVAPVPPVQPVLAVTTSALALLPLQDVPTDGSTSPNTPASDASNSTLQSSTCSASTSSAAASLPSNSPPLPRKAESLSAPLPDGPSPYAAKRAALEDETKVVVTKAVTKARDEAARQRLQADLAPMRAAAAAEKSSAATGSGWSGQGKGIEGGSGHKLPAFMLLMASAPSHPQPTPKLTGAPVRAFSFALPPADVLDGSAVVAPTSLFVPSTPGPQSKAAADRDRPVPIDSI